MKEVLFRGKTVDTNEWIQGSLVRALGYLDEDEKFFIISEDALYYNHGEFDIVKEVRRETVGQYTGLTDKNGKKIFEGDIVKFLHPAFNKSRIGVISYEMNEMGFVLRHKGDYSWIAYANKFYEVIGNIYDTKELLK